MHIASILSDFIVLCYGSLLLSSLWTGIEHKCLQLPFLLFDGKNHIKKINVRPKEKKQ